MDTTHMRRSRFWFGGNANDWELAGYESSEIKEKLTDASGFPLFKKNTPIYAMRGQYEAQPHDDAGRALKAKEA